MKKKKKKGLDEGAVFMLEYNLQGSQEQAGFQAGACKKSLGKAISLN